MSKRKKNKYSNTKINSVKEKELGPWDRPMTAKQKIIFICCSIILVPLILFAVSTIYAKHESKLHGFTDLNDLVTSYFTAIQSNDKRTIKNIFHERSLSYIDDYNDQIDMLQTINDSMQLDISTLTVEIDDEKLPLEDIETEIRLSPIDDAKLCYAKLKVYKKLQNDVTCECNASYMLQCYSVQGKWYLWSMNNIGTDIISLTDSQGNDVDINSTELKDMLPVTVGNKFVGYMSIPQDYVSTPIDPSEDYKSAVCYTASDNTSSISMYAIITNSTTEDFVRTWVEQSKMKPVVTQEIVNDISVIMIKETDDKTGLTSISIIFDNVLYDECVHLVTIDSTTMSDPEIYRLISTYTILQN